MSRNLILLLTMLLQAPTAHAAGCGGTKPIDCFNEANTLYQSGQLIEALEKAADACNRGLDLGCHLDGMISVSRGDLPRARAWLASPCLKGELSYCEALGGLEVKKGNVEDGIALLKKACAGGRQEACAKAEAGHPSKARANLQKLIEDAKAYDGTLGAELEIVRAELGRLPDDQAKLEHLKGRCERGNAAACFLGSGIVATAVGPKAVKPWLDQACTLSLAAACASGLLWCFNEGNPENCAGAYLAKTCEHGGNEACRRWTAVHSAFLKVIEEESRKPASAPAPKPRQPRRR